MIDLEEKRLSGYIEPATEDTEIGIQVIESKFNDAFARLDNLTRSSLSGIDAESLTNNTISEINSIKNLDTTLCNEFIRSSVNNDDILALANKYKDCRLRMTNSATNGYTVPDSLGDSQGYFDLAGTKSVDGTQFNSTREVLNTSMETLKGVNLPSDNLPNMAVGYKSMPGNTRSLYINMYDGIGSITTENLKNKIPFLHNQNIMDSERTDINGSTPFIMIERSNKIYSFDFGIQYMTKKESVKAYISDGTDIQLVDTKLYSEGGEYLKRFFGSFIIEETADGLDISYIMNNSEHNRFEDELPEFKFRFSYDDDFIFMYLHDVKPSRIYHSGRLVERDILEIMTSGSVSDDDNFAILKFKNDYGYKPTEDIGLFDPSITIPSGSEVYLLPNFNVNLSIKDNSFFRLDSFVVGNLYDRSDILGLGYKDVTFKCNSKSMVDLNGIRLTDSNNIQLVPDLSDKFMVRNVGIIKDTLKYGKVMSVAEMIVKNNDHIRTKVIDGKPVFYKTMMRIKSMTSSYYQNFVEFDNAPDFVITEIGRYEFINGEDFFESRSFTSCASLNIKSERDKIVNSKTLMDIFEGIKIPFKYSNIINDDVVVPNAFPVSSDNIGNTNTKSSVQILSNYYGFNIDEDNFRGYVIITTEILPCDYEFDKLTIKHISRSDNVGILGYEEGDFENDLVRENQAIMSGNDIVYHDITFTSFEKFNVFPGNHSTVDGSNVEFYLTPAQGYMIDEVMVNGVVTELTGNRFVVKNITGDVSITVTTKTKPKTVYNVYMDSFTNCTISPADGVILVDEGSGIEFSITPSFHHYINYIKVNGISVGHINGRFVISNIDEDKHINIECLEIPPEEYTIEIINDGGYCTISPGLGIFDVLEGDDFNITIEMTNSKYEIKGIKVDGVLLQTISNTVNFSTLKGSHVVEIITGRKAFIEYFSTVSVINCSVSPSGTTSIFEESNVTYTVTPNPKHAMQSVTDNGVAVTLDANKQFTINNVQGNHNIVAIAIRVYEDYILNIEAGTNCSYKLDDVATSVGSKTITEDQTYIVEIVPTAGFMVGSIVVDGVTITTNSTTYTFDKVTSGHTIKANCIPIPPATLTIFTNLTNAYVVSGTTIVTRGNNTTVVISPNVGFKVISVKVDGVTKAITELSHTFNNVQDDHIIEVICDVIYNSITASNGTNYTVNPSGVTPIQYGQSITYNFATTPGWRIKNLIVDGTTIDGGVSYTFNNVTAAHTISAVAEIIPPTKYTVTSLNGTNYSVTPYGDDPDVIENTASQVYTFTPTSGYYVKEIYTNSNNGTWMLKKSVAAPTEEPTSGPSETYQIPSVTSIMSIKAIVDVIPPKYFTISVSVTDTAGAASTNATISPGSSSVRKGTAKTFTVTPAADHKISSIVVDGVETAVSNNGEVYNYTFNNVQADHTFVVKMLRVIKYYTMNTYNGTGYTIYPLPAQCPITYPEGDGQLMTVTPASATNPNNGTSYYPYRSPGIIVNGTTYNFGSGTFSIGNGTTLDMGTDSSSGWGVKTCTILNIQTNLEISAISNKIVYNINFTQLTNCSITEPYNTSNFDLYSNNSFTMVPAAGFTITNDNIEISNDGGAYKTLTQWLIDDPTICTRVGNVLNFNNLQKSKAIKVNASQVYNTIRLVTVANCVYKDASNNVIGDGAAAYKDYSVAQSNNSFYVKAFPNTGYKIDKKWIGDLTNPPSSYQITATNNPTAGYDNQTFTNISTNKAFSVVCSKIQYSITVTQPTNGSITPTSTTIDHGNDAIFTVSPAVGYKISTITVGGVSVPLSGTAVTVNGSSVQKYIGDDTGCNIRISGVTAATTVTATMVANTVYRNVDLMTGTGYTWTNTGGTAITNGLRWSSVADKTNFTATLTITSGYTLDNIFVGEYTTSAVYAAGTAYAVGAKVKYGNRTYTALLASTGKQPDTNPTYWKVSGAFFPANTSTVISVTQNTIVEAICTANPEYDFMWRANKSYSTTDGYIVANESGVYMVYRCLSNGSVNTTGMIPKDNPTYFALANDSKSGIMLNGTGTNKLYWSSTLAYMDNGTNSMLILHNYGGGSYKVYRCNYWTLNNEPGPAAHTGGTEKYWTYMGDTKSPTWSSGSIYNAGDSVIYNGIVYTAKFYNSGRQPDIYYVEVPGVGQVWDKVGSAATAALWSSSTTYYNGNIVRYNGYVYTAVLTNTNKQPDLFNALDDSKEWKIVGQY